MDEDTGGEHAGVIGEEIAKPIIWVQDHGADWLLEKMLPMVAEEYRYVTMYFIRVVWPLFDILVLSAAVQQAYQVGGWMLTRPLTAIRLILVHVVPLFMIGSAAFLTPWPCCSRWQQIWQILLGMDTVLYVVTLLYASCDKELRRWLTDDGMGVACVVLMSLMPVQTTAAYRYGEHLYIPMLIITCAEVACLAAAAAQWLPFWSPGEHCHPCVAATAAYVAKLLGGVVFYFVDLLRPLPILFGHEANRMRQLPYAQAATPE